MGKMRTTQKELRERWIIKFYAGYCDLQYIMRFENPAFYTCGVYGWNMDVYADFSHDIIVCTGYRGMIGKLIPSEIIDRYNNIVAGYNKRYNEKEIDFDEMRELYDCTVRDFYRELYNIHIEQVKKSRQTQ